MERRKRRSFTPEFRAEAARLVREGSKSLPQVAKDLDLTESAPRNWVREADGSEGKSPAGALSTADLGYMSPVDFELAALPQKLAA